MRIDKQILFKRIKILCCLPCTLLAALAAFFKCQERLLRWGLITVQNEIISLLLQKMLSV